MDYQTNLEIAQDDQHFPAYRVELRSPFDRKYVKSYDNLAQGANTAFAPQGGHNGLWTANQANRVGRQFMERYHGGAGVGAVGNNPNCNPVNPPNFPNCQLPQGYVSAGKAIQAGCEFMAQQGPTLCDLAKDAPDMFNSEFAVRAGNVPQQYQCPAAQYITQNNCPGGGGGGPPPPPLPNCDCRAGGAIDAKCSGKPGDPCWGQTNCPKFSNPPDPCGGCLANEFKNCKMTDGCQNCLTGVLPGGYSGKWASCTCPNS